MSFLLVYDFKSFWEKQVLGSAKNNNKNIGLLSVRLLTFSNILLGIVSTCSDARMINFQKHCSMYGVWRDQQQEIQLAHKQYQIKIVTVGKHYERHMWVEYKITDEPSLHFHFIVQFNLKRL